MTFLPPIICISQSVAETENLARDLAAMIPPHTAVMLNGDLGMGKTVFARALIRALTHDQNLMVTSPTFNLAASYDAPGGAVWHYDFYRLKNTEELRELGLDDARGARATIIEWPERAGSINGYFKKIIHVNFTADHQSDHRTIIFNFGDVMDVPRTAFIFAAGFGERMKPLTLTLPKPLVSVNGTPMLQSILDLCAGSGVKNLVVNTHYLGNQIADFLASQQSRFHVTLSPETELLETGGGLRAALPIIQDDIFYAMNGDSLLMDGAGLPSLTRLAGQFSPDRMDICLLLKPVDSDMITRAVGDYRIHSDGRLSRDKNQHGTHMFTGVRILHRRIFEGETRPRFNFLELMDKAEAAGRLYGLEHHGAWHHLSTPDDVTRVSDFLRTQHSFESVAV